MRASLVTYIMAMQHVWLGELAIEKKWDTGFPYVDAMAKKTAQKDARVRI